MARPWRDGGSGAAGGGTEGAILAPSFRLRPRWAALLGGLLAVALLPAVALADPYEVQPGDTLSSIAAKFGLTTGLIQTLNPQIATPDLLYVGQRLTLPDNAVPLTDTVRLTHTVRPGETLGGLAALYGTSLAVLRALNPSLNPDLLFVGSALVVRDDFAPPPAATAEPIIATPAPAAPRLAGQDVAPYLVQPGDTYNALALRFGASVAHLFALNPAVPPDGLRAGSVIFVPRSGGATVAPIAAPTAAPPADFPTQPYTVLPGDSASQIAAAYGLTTGQLRLANPGIALDTVYVGQILHIPLNPAALTEPSPEPAAPLELTTYTVQPGDSASGVAVLHQITLEGLAQLNPTLNLSILQIGQDLLVPRVDLPPPPPGSVLAGSPLGLRYTVQPGDTFTAVAARFGLPPAELQQLNPGIDLDLLTIGQELRLPGTEPIPIVSQTIVNEVTDGLEYVAARLGLLPHTLIANNPALAGADFVRAGTPLTVPDTEGVVIVVQPGDTLAAIAAARGSSVEAIAADPRNGVADPNRLIIGQELIVPIHLPDFTWPVGGLITDGFGACRTAACGIRHRGVDISQHRTPGGPVVAIADGEITFVGGSYCCGLGLNLEISHANGWTSRYAHLADTLPALGQRVLQGETIGHSGTTGFSTGVHLHLELEHNGWGLDALNYLP